MDEELNEKLRGETRVMVGEIFIYLAIILVVLWATFMPSDWFGTNKVIRINWPSVEHLERPAELGEAIGPEQRK